MDPGRPSPPLSGFVVVELATGIPGGYCTKLLADGGADVVKVEAPGGDPLRHWSASGAHIPDGEDGALFGFLAYATYDMTNYATLKNWPLLIVVIAAGIGPWDALVLAATKPNDYARIIGEAHMSIAAFGGTFLMMVALTYFIDEGKEVDWIRAVECQLRRCASVRGLEIALVLGVVFIFATLIPDRNADDFLFAAVGGVLTFLLVEALGHVLDRRQAALGMAARGGLGAFLYLEVLDASFSFDGVIGAFALTHNLFLIAIGLGIGAMYVRSMTIMLVEKQTLAEFRYLEHGAFYSILILSVIMFGQTLWHIPEVVTGVLGSAFILIAFVSSILHNRKVAREA